VVVVEQTAELLVLVVLVVVELVHLTFQPLLEQEILAGAVAVVETFLTQPLLPPRVVLV
jgi:hypothetical protein